MSKEHDYRRYAAVTLGLVTRARSTADKGRLLAMAEAWLDLADRAHGLVRQHASKVGERALFGSKLGSDWQEAE